MRWKNAEGQIEAVEYAGNIDKNDGVGGFGADLLEALFNLGIPASCNPLPGINWNGLSPETKQQAMQERFPAKFAFYNAPLPLRNRCTTPYTAGFFGWHTSKLPGPNDISGDYVSGLNSLTEVIVQSEHSRHLFEEQGVTSPVHKIYYGYKVEDWPLIERPVDRPFTIIQYGTLTSTKAPLKTVEAFELAFPRNPNVRLVLCTRGNVFNGERPGRLPTFPRDPRIKLFDGDMTQKGIIKVLSGADCGINLSRGESFPRVPPQMALTGLPVVTVTHTGHWDFYKEGCFLPVADGPLSDSPYGGQWIEPDVESAAEQLLWAYEHREEAQAIGRAGREHIAANFNINKLESDISNYLKGFAERYE